MGLSDFGFNPYVNPRTETLFNKLGITNPQELKAVEADLTRFRTRQLKDNPIAGRFDLEHLKQINRHVFQDVYAWAGELRTNFDAGKLDFVGGEKYNFTPSSQIEKEAASLLDKVAKEDHFRNLSREEFISKAARLHSEINQIHAFPEGNGRTQRLFLEQLSAQAGHPLDLSIGTEHRIIEASIAGTKGDHAPMERLMREAADPERVKSLATALTFLDENWGRDKVAATYIASTTPGEQYKGILVGRSGDDFMLREDRNMIVIGHSVDIPASAMPRDHIQFAATDGKTQFSERAADLAALRAEADTLIRAIDAFQHHANAVLDRYGDGIDPRKADRLVAETMAQGGWDAQTISKALQAASLNSELKDTPQMAQYADRTADRASKKTEHSHSRRHSSKQNEIER